MEAVCFLIRVFRRPALTLTWRRTFNGDASVKAQVKGVFDAIAKWSVGRIGRLETGTIREQQR